MLRDITIVLANDNVELLGVNSLSDKNALSATIKLSVEVQNAAVLTKVLSKLKQIPGIVDVKREG